MASDLIAGDCDPADLVRDLTDLVRDLTDLDPHLTNLACDQATLVRDLTRLVRNLTRGVVDFGKGVVDLMKGVADLMKEVVDFFMGSRKPNDGCVFDPFVRSLIPFKKSTTSFSRLPDPGSAVALAGRDVR